MIFDSIENFIDKLPKYMPRCGELITFLNAAREKSFEELKDMDFAPLDLHFDEYETKPRIEIPFEAHRKYWDLQIMMEGDEFIGCSPLEKLIETVPYDRDEDIAYYSGSGQEIRMSRGMALLIAPWDGHQPCVMTGDSPEHVKKIVAKLPW